MTTTTSKKASVIGAFLKGLKPTKKITVTQWSNKYRYLDAKGAARPGRYSSLLTPYFEEIADNLSESSEVSEVDFMKAAQIGATELGNNWLGYVMHIAPAASLMVMPTDELAKTNSEIRIDPMISASPVLKKLIKPARSRDSGNTKRKKEFPLGFLIMTGAGSPASLRSMPIKNLMLDEVDGYEMDIGKEGSPISLALARTRTYMDTRKIFKLSTPTIDGISVIQKGYLNSDQRKYFFPCPHCGLMQTIEWENIRWDKEKNDPSGAWLECKGCDKKIEERHKMDMLKVGNGVWIATNENWNNPKRRGYHLSALYSMLGYKWEDAVRDYLACENDEDLKAWYNTVLGEAWKELVDVPDSEALYNRREDYKDKVAPASAAFLTCGVDIQRDRIEYEVVAWSKGKVSHSIDYSVILGDTSKIQIWDELATVVGRTYKRADGMVMGLFKMAVDTGYNANEAYAFCRRFDIGQVIGIKSSNQDNYPRPIGAPQAVEVSENGKPIGTSKVFTVGASLLKTQLYGWLRQFKEDDQADPVGYCHFPKNRDLHYFKMITAEHRVLETDKKGYAKYVWHLPSRARNEALDCRVYAMAGAYQVGMEDLSDDDWDELRSQYGEYIEEEEAPVKEKRENKFLGGKSFW